MIHLTLDCTQKHDATPWRLRQGKKQFRSIVHYGLHGSIEYKIVRGFSCSLQKAQFFMSENLKLFSIRVTQMKIVELIRRK